MAATVAENVELKARLADPAATLARALALGARDAGTLHQRDTYFPAAIGRLKLRVTDRGGVGGSEDGTDGRDAELIAYARSDAPGAALSRYVRAPADPAVAAALAAALGTRIVVTKRRRLLLHENVRLHFDEVDGLGSFLEFEAVLGVGEGRAEGEAKVATLQHALGIGAEDLVAVGYADLLEQSAETLAAAAARAWQHAYAPYSQFRVGAAIRGASGAIYVGANVENAAYSQTQCAEASAIGVMIAAGERRITAVAVASEQLDVCTPCGGCRQRLAEFAAPDTPVYLGPETSSVGELLPGGFTL
jgi:homotetrameric cytidine deaminase